MISYLELLVIMAATTTPNNNNSNSGHEDRDVEEGSRTGIDTASTQERRSLI